MDRELLLIRMLLVMGCVERNPGPPVKKFTFRYQYLLIHVGTQVIRKIFDGRARPDLITFLTKHRAKLQVMIKKKTITPAQEELLPPKEPNPSSEHFDITLTCCMLRNICGLCPPGDKVWSQPASTDKSLEAYITRLRLCRNNVSHSESVLEDQTILEKKWTELCDILTELGKFCNFQDLPTLIKTAESIEIDEHLKARFEAALNLWDEVEYMFDHGLGEIMKELGANNKRLEGMDAKLEKMDDKIERLIQTNDCRRVDNISYAEVVRKKSININQQQLRFIQLSPLAEHKKAVRQQLIDIYQQQFEFIQLCPLVKNEKGKIFNFYQVPEMKVVDYHKTEKLKSEQSHSGHTLINCRDIFCKGAKQCINIYLTADAGLGKTTFSRVLAFLWCNSKLGNQIKNDKLQDYANYLTRFEFVFYINLRDTEELNVVSMIKNQLKPYLSDDKSANLHETIEQILNNHESLVILDGLDEWVPKQIDKQKHELPIKPRSSKCVYFTLCRPYKIESVRLSRLDIDNQINMVGFNKKSKESYVASLVHYINTINDDSKDPENFFVEVKRVGLSFLPYIPMITSQLVMLWFDRPITSMSRSMIYGNIIDLLFKIAHERKIDIPAQTSFNLPLPGALSDLYYLKANFSLVGKLCLLSFRLYFEHDINITSLVFTREQLASEPYNLSEAETNLFCKIGILSTSQVYRKFGKQELKVSFLHKSYLEFLAAVYVSTLETSQVLDLFNTCATIDDVLKFKNFLIFYAGLSPEGIKSLISKIYSLISDDLILNREYLLNRIPLFTDILVACYVEGSCRVENKILCEDFVFEYPHNITYAIERKNMILKKLLSLNVKNVKLLETKCDIYLDEFDKITNLQWLRIEFLETNCYDVKFNELMLQNKSSLHTVDIHPHRSHGSRIFISDLPINSLQHLTSLTLWCISFSHKCLQSAVKFLSNNILMKSIDILAVYCYEHETTNSPDCTIPFEFKDCNKLERLDISRTNISCLNVNVSSLKEICLYPLSKNIAACYDGIFDCLQHASALSKLYCQGNQRMLSDTIKHLIDCIQFLPSLKNLHLEEIEIPDSIHLTLHPDVTKLNIYLYDVTLSDKCFKSLINNITKIEVGSLRKCIITQTDGDNINKMSNGKSCAFIYDYLKTVPTVNIISSRKMMRKSCKIIFEVGERKLESLIRRFGLFSIGLI